MKHIIYADNAATTKMDIETFEAMKPYLLNEYGNASQPYLFAQSAKKALKKSRETIANCIGSQPDEIYFTSGGTESDNWAIKGSALADLGKRIMVTSVIEHHAVLRACSDIERMGYPVTYLPVNHFGEIETYSLSKVITKDTRLVSIMLSNNEIGTIQNIRELANIAHSSGAIFHTDAVQTVGHMNINVNSLGVDMLSASAHKFNGPKGIGFLYIRKGTPIYPYFSGGSQEFSMRAGTENVASIVGMAFALEKNLKLLAESTAHINDLEQQLIQGLQNNNIDFVRNGSHYHIPGNLSLSFHGRDGEVLLHRLDLMGICVSTGSACDSKRSQISHVLQAIGLDESTAKGTIRISLGKFNTSEEVTYIVYALSKILK